MILFRAAAVAAEVLSDIGAEVAVFAEHLDGSGRRLELQRSISSDQADAKLGHDTYCLVTDEGVTHYSGIEAWGLSANEFRLQLDASASEALGVNRKVEILINLTPQQISSLEASLQSILREVTC